jgi:maltose O-acetyltransferase
MIRTPALTLGDRAFVNAGVAIHNTRRVTLGPGVAIGPSVLITTTHHELGPPARRAGRWVGRPVEIGAGTWVGARATILSGVSIGEGCVIGAGAVVTRDCAPHGLYVGVPARRKADLPTAKPATSGSRSMTAR